MPIGFLIGTVWLKKVPGDADHLHVLSFLSEKSIADNLFACQVDAF